MAKKGRPKGSKNKQYDLVREIPAACRMCGSTDLVLVKWNKPLVRRISGKIEGRIYDHVRWDQKVCKNCNQATKVLRYLAGVKNNNGKAI